MNSRTHTQRLSYTHAKRTAERGERRKERRCSRRQREPRAISHGSSPEPAAAIEAALHTSRPRLTSRERERDHAPSHPRERERGHTMRTTGAERETSPPPAFSGSARRYASADCGALLQAAPSLQITIASSLPVGQATTSPQQLQRSGEPTTSSQQSSPDLGELRYNRPCVGQRGAWIERARARIAAECRVISCARRSPSRRVRGSR